MSSVLNQLPNSTLSLTGNNFRANPNSPAWGFRNSGGSLNPYLSRLHYEPLKQNGYSVDGTPVVRIVDFNSRANQGLTLLGPPSLLDELDRNAPRNTQVAPPRVGSQGSVVSQIYKSPTGRQYRDLGPSDGRY